MSGNRENLTLPVALIGSEFAAALGCVLRWLGGCNLRRNWLYSPWVVGHRFTRPDHLCNNWMILFVLHDPGDCLDESIGSFHQRLASASGLSSTMAMSISSPSFLMRAGLPACIRRTDGSVGMALVLPALTDCRWWFESLLVHSRVSSATRRKATGADKKKWSAGLHLLHNCYCFVLTKVSFPLLYSSLRQ